jgi:hypothetical protein
MIARTLYFNSLDDAMEWYNTQVAKDCHHNYSEPKLTKKKGYIIIVRTTMKARTDRLIGGRTEYTFYTVTDFKRNKNIYHGTQIQKWQEQKNVGIDNTLYCDICGGYQEKGFYRKYKMCENCYKKSKQERKVK